MLSLCMIVKNEARFLGGCLLSAASHVDEIIVVDTGSTDNTKQIALEHGAKVYDFAWVDDFAAAKNYAAGQATYNLILSLDADEVILSFDKGFLTMPDTETGSILIRNMHDSGVCFTERITRLYDKRFFCFKGRIHEQIARINGGTHEIIELPIVIEHFGYSRDVIDSKNKILRNRRLLLSALETSPDDPYYLYQIGKTYFAEKDYSVAVDYFEKTLIKESDTRLDYIYNCVLCLGYALINSGQYDRAVIVFNFVDLYQKHQAFRFLLGHICQNNGKFSEAIKWFESCVGDFDELPRYLPLYNIGVIFEAAGVLDSAVKYYELCGDYPKALERGRLVRNALRNP